MDISHFVAHTKAPRRRPILGDFDGDGAADVIVVGDDAVWGFSLQYAPGGGGAFRLVVTVMVVAMAVIFFANLQVDEDSSGRKAKKRTTTARLHRSTD